MKKGKMRIQKAASIFMVMLMIVSSIAIHPVLAADNSKAAVIYVNGEGGSDAADGTTAQSAVSSYNKAVDLAQQSGASIKVSGTIHVSGNATWYNPVSRADGFSGKLVAVADGSTLTLSGFTLSASDYSGNVVNKKDEPKAEEPKKEEAPKQETQPAAEEQTPETQPETPVQPETPAQPEVPVKQPAAQVSVPDILVMAQPQTLVNLPIAQELCSGDGVFSWADGAFVPSTYETDCQVIFTPNDITNYDYSAIPGWDAGSNTVIRTIKVQVTSLKPAEQPAVDETHDGETPSNDNTQTDAVNPAEGDNTPAADDSVQTPAEGTPVDGTSSADNSQQTVVDSSNDGTVDKTIEDGSLEDESKKDETTKDETTADETTEDEGLIEDNSDALLTEEPVATPEPIQPVFMADAIVNHVTAVIVALPNTIDSNEKVMQVINATKAFESLTDVQKNAVTQETKDYLVNVQALAGLYNRTSNGVSVVGDLPWYIQFQVTMDNDTTTYEQPNVDTIIAPYEMTLWNLMTDSKYELNGQKVQITMPAPSSKDYTRLVIVHYLSDGSLEYITPTVVNDTISFMTSSFSPFNIAGSKVIAGGTVVSGGYGNSSSGGSNSSSGSNTSAIASAAASVDSNNSSGNSSVRRSGNSNSSSSSSSAKNAVSTGDYTNIALYAGLALAALLIAGKVSLTIRRKRRCKTI